MTISATRNRECPLLAQAELRWRIKSAKGHARTSENVRAAAARSANVGHEAMASMKSVSLHEGTSAPTSVTQNSRS